MYPLRLKNLEKYCVLYINNYSILKCKFEFNSSFSEFFFQEKKRVKFLHLH